MTLQFYVKNQSLTIAPNQKDIQVVADSKNYLKAKFIFQSSEWKKGLVSVLFSHSGKTYRKILGAEEGLAADECYVAPEVIKSGKFSVSLFCDNRVTTNTVEVPVLKSGYTENIENQKATPGVMEQMNDLMYKYAKICNDILNECKKIENKKKEEK